MNRLKASIVFASGGLRIIYRQVSGTEILLEYANTRDVVYELYERILENRKR